MKSCRKSTEPARSIAPEHRGKRGNRADQEARRVNKLDVGGTNSFSTASIAFALAFDLPVADQAA